MKIGVTQIVLGDMTLPDTLELCGEAGYDAVELVFNPGSDLHPDMSEKELSAVARQCEQSGVEMVSVIANLSGRGNLLSRDEKERDKCCRCVTRSIEIASTLGVGATLLHPGQLPADGTYQEAWDDLRDALKKLAVLAEERQVAIGLENVWNKFLLSPDEAVRFVDEVDSEWVGFYLDTANMMAYGYPEHWIRALGPRIVRVHVKDFDRSQHAFVNLQDGDTDWFVVMAELRRVGYTSSIIHEISGDQSTLIDLGRRMRKITSM
tara:strand:+ start:1790 stop:2581 length:792 start_codon:yes stop_codon:yes gene_type:complete